MRQHKIFHQLAIGLTFIFTSAAHAFQFSPIYATLTPTGQGKSFTFIAVNPNDEKAAVQISMFDRDEDIDGIEKNQPADAKFNVYPKQFLLRPKETKRVRVTWLGEKPVDRELPFRLQAVQLAVEGLEKKNKSDKGGQIKILMKYVVSLYVEPEHVEPNVQVKAAEIVTVDKTEMLHVVFENKGLKHRLLDEPKLKVTFTANGKAQDMELEAKLTEPLKEKNLLPGHERQFYIPWNQPKPEGLIKVDLSLKAPL